MRRFRVFPDELYPAYMPSLVIDPDTGEDSYGTLITLSEEEYRTILSAFEQFELAQRMLYSKVTGKEMECLDWGICSVSDTVEELKMSKFEE
jgi:hypothetical protein